MIIYIYTLTKHNKVYYVGRTKNIKQRIRDHRSHGRFDSDSTYEIVDECDRSNMTFWERHYISLFKSWGFKLINKTEQEHIKNLSESLKGRKGPWTGISRVFDKEFKHKGKPWSEARREAQKNRLKDNG